MKTMHYNEKNLNKDPNFLLFHVDEILHLTRPRFEFSFPREQNYAHNFIHLKLNTMLIPSWL